MCHPWAFQTNNVIFIVEIAKQSLCVTLEVELYAEWTSSKSILGRQQRVQLPIDAFQFSLIKHLICKAEKFFFEITRIFVE